MLQYYHLVIKDASCIRYAVSGNFLGKQAIEIIVSNGYTLELYNVDEERGWLHSLFQRKFPFAIASLVHQPNSEKDSVVIISEFGQVISVEYDVDKNNFELIPMYSFERANCFHNASGHFFTAALESNSKIIGVIKKPNIFCIFSPNTSVTPDNLHISNMYDIIAIYNGADKVMFAILEEENLVSDNSSDQHADNRPKQYLSFYVYSDSHISKNPVHREALKVQGNMLISVPASSNHHSGVIVCSNNEILLKPLNDFAEPYSPEYFSLLPVPQLIPQRQNDVFSSKQGFLLTSSVVYKPDERVLILAQTEQGDLFLIYFKSNDKVVSKIKMLYIDTVPVASAMCILSDKFLFIAANFGNHFLYKILSHGHENYMQVIKEGIRGQQDLIVFKARKLENLKYVKEFENLSPIHQCSIIKNGVTHPEFYLACGNGSASYLRKLKFELPLDEKEPSCLVDFQKNPVNSVWILNRKENDKSIPFIVLSDCKSTFVMSEDFEEDKLSEFNSSEITLHCFAVGDNTFVQVFPSELRFIKIGTGGTEIKTHKVKKIKENLSLCTSHKNQFYVSSKEAVLHLEVDMLGNFTEKYGGQFEKLIMGLKFTPDGYLAISTENAVLICEPGEKLTVLNAVKLPEGAISENLAFMKVSENGIEHVYLYIGLKDGILHTAIWDSTDKTIKTCFNLKVGTNRMRLVNVKLLETDAILVLSNLSWISFCYKSKLHTIPFARDIDCATSFSSSKYPSSIIAISKKIRIFGMKSLEFLSTRSFLQLDYSPRKIAEQPDTKNIMLLQSDPRPPHHKYGEINPQTALNLTMVTDPENHDINPDLELRSSSDCVLHLLDTEKGDIKLFKNLYLNETATSLCFVKFEDVEYVILGIKKDILVTPPVYQCFLRLYEVSSNNKVAEEKVEDVPSAISCFGAELLVGIGNLLCVIYFEKDYLKRRAFLKMPKPILLIETRWLFFMIGDAYNGLYYGCFERAILHIFEQDEFLIAPTCICFWDNYTVVGANKSGNIYFIKLPGVMCKKFEKNESDLHKLTTQNIFNRNTSGLLKTQVKSSVNSTKIYEYQFITKFLTSMEKSYLLVKYNVRQPVVSLKKTKLIKEGCDMIVYTTVNGEIGVLMQCINDEDNDFLKQLQFQLQFQLNSRNIYIPYQGPSASDAIFVINGNLCELFWTLNSSDQEGIVKKLEKHTDKVKELLQKMRILMYFDV